MFDPESLAILCLLMATEIHFWVLLAQMGRKWRIFVLVQNCVGVIWPLHWHRRDLVPQLSTFLLLVSSGNRLDLLQIYQLFYGFGGYMSSPESLVTNVILNLSRMSFLRMTFSWYLELAFFLLKQACNATKTGKLRCFA